MSDLAVRAALSQLLSRAGLPMAALENMELPADGALFGSSFEVGQAAQCSIAAAAVAAECIYHQRTGAHQSVRVPRSAAELECTAYFTLNGERPNAWEKFSGLYETHDGHVRVHANFDHHRDGVLALLNLPLGEVATRDDVALALSEWSADEFEDAAAQHGLVVAKVRTFDEWDQHPHAAVARALPLVDLQRIERLPGEEAPAHPLPTLAAGQRPLSDIRVLDLTRILAGPICGRTLAAYGADVMLVNSPNLPNINSIIDTSRGKRSAHIDLAGESGVQRLKGLLTDTDVFVQGYRPGALAARGLAPADLAAIRPGIVCVSLSAYGNEGPWGGRRGFDSLVQTATGFNHDEADAAGSSTPRSLPVPILDYASGFLMAFGAQAALLKQAQEGGSWSVDVSLVGTACWLRNLGRVKEGFKGIEKVELEAHLAEFECLEGQLRGLPHAAEFSATPAGWKRPSSMPGTDEPRWSA